MQVHNFNFFKMFEALLPVKVVVLILFFDLLKKSLSKIEFSKSWRYL